MPLHTNKYLQKMQRRREKDRLLKLAVCSKICSAMQFITCPSETRGHWLTERRNMSEKLELKCLVTSPHISSMKLRILQPFVTFNENMVKRNRTVKKKMVLRKQQISCSGNPHSPISICLLGVSFQESVFPSLPRRGLKCLPHPQCAHFKTSTVPSSALLPPPAGMKRPAPGQDRVAWGQTPFGAHVSGAEGLFALLTREMDTHH